ncbi:MAG: SPOR domain-containing protein [Gammaproteobacteria bacterium]|nr:SPOR domain-containing protein [Gammaproteobacteria bacterium]
MKALFLVLLSINALYLGWRMWIVPTEAPPAFVEAGDIPRLQLVGEGADGNAASDDLAAASSGVEAIEPLPEGIDESLEAVAEVAAADDEEVATPEPIELASAGSVSEPPAAEAAAPACMSLGPFVNLREATEATARLNDQGLQPSQRLSESQVWFGHWVHLPSLPSRDAAIAIVEDLRAKGITDIYIEPSGPFRNSISLGVFSDAAHAETRAGQIRRMGVSPQIRDRYRDSSVYWVDFDLPPGMSLDPTDYQATPSRVLRLEPC